MDAITTGPAIVRNGRMDLLATNHLGRAMHSSLYDRDPTSPPNFARYTFLDEHSHRFYPDWDTAADTAVAILRTEAGRDSHDKELHDLVGELSTRSPDFRRRWSAHNVRLHSAGTTHFHHHVVGDLTLAYESLDMISEPGLTLTGLRRRTSLPHRTRARPTRLLDRHPNTPRRQLSQPEPAQLHAVSTSEDGLRVLASWAATLHQIDAASTNRAARLSP